jgi:anti-anti-sigma factor
VDDVERGPTSPLQIHVSWDGVAATVTATGELDAATAPGLTERLITVANAHPERLVLDLACLVFVYVAGIRALDRAHQALQAQCPVIVRRPQPSARKGLGATTWMDG